MLRVYFVTAWRSLWKKKFYTAINILGLSVATAAFILLVNYVRFERSYENNHSKADNIYRLTLDLYNGAAFVVADCETYPAMGPEFKASMPEVQEYVRMQDLGESELRHNNNAFLVSKGYGADPSLFDVFDVQFIAGDKRSVLQSSSHIVLSETLANRFFGKADVVGETLMYSGEPMQVEGVIKDMPENTHLKFDLLVSMKLIEKWGQDLTSWSGNNNYTYLLMKPGTDLVAFNNNLEAFSKKRLKREIVTAEPIKSIHLYSNKTFEPEMNGNARTVDFLLMVAIFIILIGSANYINLTTARGAERSKEAGLRKVLGSSRTSLIKLFFTESFVINILAVGGGLVLVALARPLYVSIVGEGAAANLFQTTAFWILAGLLLLLNAFLSGLYPAFVLSSVKAAVVTSRHSTGTMRGSLLRKTLVAGQFAVALIVLSASVIVYQQLQFVKGQDLGMNIDQVLILRKSQIGDSDTTTKNLGHVFRNRLMETPGVQKVALAGSLPGLGLHSLNTTTDVRRYEDVNYAGTNFYLYGVDAEYVPLMDMEMAAGKNFSKVPAENMGKVLINEETARVLGFTSPEAAINQRLQIGIWRDEASVITGVLKNYHQLSLKEAQIPMVHWYQEEGTDFYAIRLKTTDMPATLAGIEESWKRIFPGRVYDYFFMDEMFNRQYKADVQFGKIIGLFAVFTLFITILGLLGLAAYDASRRTKEIGIRKILGASPATILTLLSKDFLKLVIVSIIIAVPLCWFIINKWLENFAYRIEINWLVFLFTSMVVVLVAFFTICFQSLKAISTNPVKSLRTE